VRRAPRKPHIWRSRLRVGWWLIRLSVEQRSLEQWVSDDELERRRAALPARPESSVKRGYAKLYEREILQADDGCDFQFLK
jgi:dihydroxy-acid dehydratase